MNTAVGQPAECPCLEENSWRFELCDMVRCHDTRNSDAALSWGHLCRVFSKQTARFQRISVTAQSAATRVADMPRWIVTGEKIWRNKHGLAHFWELCFMLEQPVPAAVIFWTEPLLLARGCGSKSDHQVKIFRFTTIPEVFKELLIAAKCYTGYLFPGLRNRGTQRADFFASPKFCAGFFRSR